MKVCSDRAGIESYILYHQLLWIGKISWQITTERDFLFHFDFAEKSNQKLFKCTLSKIWVRYKPRLFTVACSSRRGPLDAFEKLMCLLGSPYRRHDSSLHVTVSILGFCPLSTRRNQSGVNLSLHCQQLGSKSCSSRRTSESETPPHGHGPCIQEEGSRSRNAK